MSLADLVTTSAAPLSNAEHIDRMKKLIARTFGVEADQIGAVEMVDGNATLKMQHEGRDVVINWGRDAKARVIWYINGSPALGLGGDNALGKLQAALERQA